MTNTRYRNKGPNPSGIFCLLHGNLHLKSECPVSCGFCTIVGSHYADTCWSKDKAKQQFVENKIRIFGVNSERAALSLVNDQGINRITNTEFEALLNGKPLPPHGKNYEDYKQRARHAD